MLPSRGSFLGSGSFGSVYRGTDAVHGEVALKVLTQWAGESDPDWRARKDALIVEGQRLSDATHPNVVRVFSVHESPSGDEMTLVLEFCAGGALEGDYQTGPLAPNKVRNYATEISLGLNALHARGMLHRDIKPANVLLDSSGRARVSDFGLVTNNVVLGYASEAGYLDHLAYEVHHGKGTSVKTDIWALGMTLYRLLHGHPWYTASAMPRRSVPAGGFASKLEWLPHISDAWRRLIRKAMHDDPAHRFQTMQNVLDALARIPIAPAWETTIGPATIEWRLARNDRHYSCILDRQTKQWEANSLPLGPGRKRRLGRSSGLKSLEEFFAAFK